MDGDKLLSTVDDVVLSVDELIKKYNELKGVVRVIQSAITGKVIECQQKGQEGEAKRWNEYVELIHKVIGPQCLDHNSNISTTEKKSKKGRKRWVQMPLFQETI